jgi:AraC-like DNA-binding protein
MEIVNGGGHRPRIIFAGRHRGEREFPEHNHDGSWEIVYLWQGKLAERQESEIIPMQPGTFVVHPPGVRHGDVAESDYLLYHVQFDVDGDPGWPRVAMDDALQSVGTTMQAIVQEWYSAEPDRDAMLRLLASRMNLLLRRSVWHRQLIGAENIVASVQTVFRQRFKEQITIDEVALSVGVSRSALYAHFKGVLGKTPLEVLNDVRVKNAIYLLRYSHTKIADIAGDCGFCSASHLSRRLKESTGYNPRQIRASAFRQIGAS